MLNEGFKIKSSIPMQGHSLNKRRQLQTPPSSVVSGSWAQFFPVILKVNSVRMFLRVGS